MNAFRVVIPARLASTRLPGKPLADIHGKPMVVHVLERALASGAGSVCVATDDVSVRDAVVAHGGEALLTRPDHPSGTDRLAEVATRMGWDDEEIVVNVQGDEPLIDPVLIRAVAEALARAPGAAVATAAHAVHDADDFFNPNVVKVVCDAHGHAPYFSRAPIPWARDAFASRPTSPLAFEATAEGKSTSQSRRAEPVLPEGLPVMRHVGLYAYRVAFLRCYCTLSPSPLEQWEALEQLRVLWHGHRIVVLPVAETPEAGVDTAADLERVRQKFDQQAPTK